ncbi:zeta toxin family protein [Streptomyces sp. B1I3]|uniref:zeta toxin family protein n=1 Tax=Streptomyces sp. B1I3 TaxID=3042264 RepID=UPI00278B8980|nr:zeta toxin family protein [Streptomyces sp. B1I3]MDQ0796314.1 putative kinase [Streptomyces sp. B1I3]
MDHPEVLLIGGRAGAGKTTVGWEVSDRLRATGTAHAIVEGDYLGQVHPAPAGDPHRSSVTEANLTAVWRNYAGLGYRRLIYTNTVSVLSDAAPMFERALGPGVRIVRVLLTATDATALERLSAREIGTSLDREVAGSARKARLLDAQAPPDTRRVVTDGRTVAEIAAEVLALTGWQGRGR